MIGMLVGWWAVSSLLGAAALPAVWRLSPRLADRGFGLARAAGLLAAAYLLWLGASLGWLRNGPAGALLALMVLALSGLVALRGRFSEFASWLRERASSLLLMEAIFLVAFVGWGVVRAFNPEIVATEKPMELAFLNAILLSPDFPPHDPWLSGSAISYYYLGYVLLSVPTWLTGVSAGEAFNLGNALWFALVVSGSYSLVYNLLASRGGLERRAAALLGPLFVVLTGNLGGVFEVMHSLHWGWRQLVDGTLVSPFWAWLNLEDLVRPPAGPPAFPPNRFWFWWQASRVVNDIDLAGVHVEVIDEFPFFSFLLADNHPHVLALPVALLAISAALHVFLTERPAGHRFGWIAASGALVRLAPWALGLAVGAARIASSIVDAPAAGLLAPIASGVLLGAVAAALAAVLVALASGRVASPLSSAEILVLGFLAGALAFLNTWDLPIYLALAVAAGAWGMRRAGRRAVLPGAGAATVAVGVVAGVAVLPWLPTFASQAGGILPNLVFPTRFPQFLIMFAVPLVPIGIWFARRARQAASQANLKPLAGISLGAPLALLAGSWLLAGMIAVFRPDDVPAALAGMGASSAAEVAAEALVRRATSSWTALLLALVLALGWLMLRRWSSAQVDDPERTSSDAFVVLMVMLGAGLVLVPEFFYLKDSFGTRMNTVFKFYYAAWIVWGVAAAYALASLSEGRSRWWAVRLVAAALPVALGLVYTTTALWEKANHFDLPWQPTLDGTAHLDRNQPADAAAIRWMTDNLPFGVVAEAVGGSYTGFGRVSAHTGFPTVLGWDFHEYQWRGDYAPQGTRAADIERLYVSRDWEEARAILDGYGIRYVYVGPLERSAYVPLVTRKFEAFMDRLYDNGEVVIFGRRSGGGP